MSERPLWQRRTAAIGILALLVALAWILLVTPIAGLLTAQRDWREEIQGTLARYRALAENKNAIDGAMSELEANAAWRGLYQSPEPVAASAALLSEFRALLDPQKVGIQSIQPIEAENLGPITRIGVKVSLALTVDQLRSVLERMGSNAHAMRADNIIVTAPQFHAPEENPQLIVHMEVSGFMPSAPQAAVTS